VGEKGDGWLIVIGVINRGSLVVLRLIRLLSISTFALLPPVALLAREAGYHTASYSPIPFTRRQTPRIVLVLGGATHVPRLLTCALLAVSLGSQPQPLWHDLGCVDAFMVKHPISPLGHVQRT
jgi:hypothetical protein